MSCFLAHGFKLISDVSDICTRQVLGVQSSSLQGKHLGVPRLREALGTGICFKNKVT